MKNEPEFANILEKIQQTSEKVYFINLNECRVLREKFNEMISHPTSLPEKYRNIPYLIGIIDDVIIIENPKPQTKG